MAACLHGMGNPIDGGPEILPEAYMDINGLPMNPAARDYPSEFIQTGSLRSTGSIPWFADRNCRSFPAPVCRMPTSPPRSPARQKYWGRIRSSPSCLPQWAITFEESEFFVREFKRTGAIDRTVLFTNLANDPQLSASLPRAWH